MQTFRRLTIFSVILTVCMSSMPAQRPGGGGPPAANVDVARVTEGDIFDIVRLTGTVQPWRFSRVTTDVEGLVAERFVDEGDVVTTGTVLVRLRTDEIELNLREAEQNLALENSRLQELRNGTRPEDVDVLRARVAEAEARVALARAENRRIEELLTTRVSSQSDFDRTQAEMMRAEAELARQRAELERAINGARTEELDAQEARTASARARFDRLNDQLQRHHVRAPFAGVVGNRQIEVGEWLGKGDPVFAVAEVHVMLIRVDVPEAIFNRVPLGTMAQVELDAVPGRTFETPVVLRNPVGDTASRTFAIRLGVRNDDLLLAPGMMARVTFALRDRVERSIMVPRDAVVMAPDRTQRVWVVVTEDEGLAAYPREITTGRASFDSLEVLSGDIRPGDLIVIRGNETLRMPGQRVNIRQSGTPTPAPAEPVS